mmetsp:Transcript_31844/g.83234  ORF Transcript_31844/g.83234 Transcript_31844/m.83234 type:complete len:177 (+) Transcript_31844:163-693(+)
MVPCTPKPRIASGQSQVLVGVRSDAETESGCTVEQNLAVIAYRCTALPYTLHKERAQRQTYTTANDLIISSLRQAAPTAPLPEQDNISYTSTSRTPSHSPPRTLASPYGLPTSSAKKLSPLLRLESYSFFHFFCAFEPFSALESGRGLVNLLQERSACDQLQGGRSWESGTLCSTL